MERNIENLLSNPTTIAMALRIAGRGQNAGRHVTGLVLTDKSGSRCIVENGVTKWFSAEEWENLMQTKAQHPRDHAA